MAKVKAKGIPKFDNEQDEAKWWASAEGRKFLKEQAAAGSVPPLGGSRLVAKLARAGTVQH